MLAVYLQQHAGGREFASRDTSWPWISSVVKSTEKRPFSRSALRISCIPLMTRLRQPRTLHPYGWVDRAFLRLLQHFVIVVVLLPDLGGHIVKALRIALGARETHLSLALRNERIPLPRAGNDLHRSSAVIALNAALIFVIHSGKSMGRGPHCCSSRYGF